MIGLMMMKNKVSLIEEYLDTLYPNPRCELDYAYDYQLLIATVLSAQCTDKRVNSVTKILWNKYNSLYELSVADISDIENILRPLGSFRKKAIYIVGIAKILVSEYDSKVPNDRVILESLPGVGRKTTNVVLSNLFDYPAIAVDTHVDRVSKRLGLAAKNDSVLTVENKLMKKINKNNWSKIHHQLVLFGRYNCKAVNPDCTNCKLKEICKNK